MGWRGAARRARRGGRIWHRPGPGRARMCVIVSLGSPDVPSPSPRPLQLGRELRDGRRGGTGPRRCTDQKSFAGPPGQSCPRPRCDRPCPSGAGSWRGSSPPHHRSGSGSGSGRRRPRAVIVPEGPLGVGERPVAGVVDQVLDADQARVGAGAVVEDALGESALGSGPCRMVGDGGGRRAGPSGGGPRRRPAGNGAPPGPGPCGRRGAGLGLGAEPGKTWVAPSKGPTRPPPETPARQRRRVAMRRERSARHWTSFIPRGWTDQ